MNIKKMTLLAMCTTILFVSKQALSFLPNIQIIVLLLVVYSKVFKLKDTLLIILVYVLLDSIFYGSLNLIYFPATLVGWMIIPLFINTIIKTDNEYKLGIYSIIHAIIYSLVFIPASMLTYGFDIKSYLIAGVVFTILMSVSSFISIILMYKPIEKVLRNLKEDYER